MIRIRRTQLREARKGKEPVSGIALTVKGYLSICRVSNLPSIWTNALCAYLLATGGFSWRGYVFPALALSCLYLAGMTLNDFCDSGEDAIRRPSRPIPSGAVSAQEAFWLSVALILLGLLLLLGTQFKEGLIAGSLLIALIVWYDLDHKDNPYSVLLMGACRLLIFVVTSLSVAGDLTPCVLLAGVAHFTYVVCLSLVARYENGRRAPFSFPVIPVMLAGVCLIDGIILALLVAPVWLLAGLGGALMMQQGQKLVRGD